MVVGSILGAPYVRRRGGDYSTGTSAMPAGCEAERWDGGVANDVESQCCVHQCQRPGRGDLKASSLPGGSSNKSSSNADECDCCGESMLEAKEHSSRLDSFWRRLSSLGSFQQMLGQKAAYEPVPIDTSCVAREVLPLGDMCCTPGTGEADAAAGTRTNSSLAMPKIPMGFAFPATAGPACSGNTITLSPDRGGSPGYHLSRSVSTETMIVEGLSVDLSMNGISPPTSSNNLTATIAAWRSGVDALGSAHGVNSGGGSTLPMSQKVADEAGMELVAAQTVRRGFVVLGVDITYWGENQQYLFCAGGIFAFLLVYGYLQEYLVVQVFQRKLGLFLTLLQFGGYTAYAFLQRAYHNDLHRAVPWRYYLLLALMQAAMQGLTNVSMSYLNYPAKVLFKSSRVVPTMIFGILYQGRRYTRRDYMVVLLIVAGLVVFMEADAASSPAFDIRGVVLICVALIIDAAIINIQEEIMQVYDSNHDELILYSYLGGTVIVFLSNVWTGELWEGAAFLQGSGWGAITLVMLFAGTGFLGVSCVAALTKRFGALVCAITTTARKAATLLLSFCFFPKPITPSHFVGVTLFITGLVVKSCRRRGGSSASSSTHHGASGALALPKVKLASGMSLATDANKVGQGGGNAMGSPERLRHRIHNGAAKQLTSTTTTTAAPLNNNGSLAAGAYSRESYATCSTVCSDMGSPGGIDHTSSGLTPAYGGNGGASGLDSGRSDLFATTTELPRPGGIMNTSAGMAAAAAAAASEGAVFAPTPPSSVLMM